jgi:cytoskeletal protein CcmA (bactofilin family)
MSRVKTYIADVTLTTAAQTNITSLGTLTALTVDNVAINGTTIGHTDDTDLMTVADGVLTVAGEVDATSLDISGDADIDGTLEADAITVNGTALNTVIAGVTVTNATNSAHVLVTDNESTNEENLITFVEDATTSTGNVGLEMDGNFSYNPSTGTVTATIFKGNIDAVDGDFDGTLEADAITVNGTALNTVIADEATALAIALG